MQYDSVSHESTDRRLGRLPSGREIAVTVHRYVGGNGPTAYVQAAQHGIELNGPAALRRLHDRLLEADIAGTVVLVPMVNPLAFDHRSYMTPAEYDVMNPNLNRVWPGDDDGSLQERLAARLWDVVEGADVAVDLHTGTADMLEHVRYRQDSDTARRFADAFGTEYCLVDSEETADVSESGGTFRAAAADAGVPAVTAELSNSRQLRHAAIESGADGVENVLRAADILDDDPPSSNQTVLREQPDPVTAEESGLFELRPDVEVGATLEAGERLGTIYDPSTFERLAVVEADEGGVAYSLAREAVVVAGERVGALGTPVTDTTAD